MSFEKWARRVATLNGAVRRSRPTRTSHRARLESLETRWVFAAPTLADLPNVTVLAGAPLHIALNGADTDGDALTFSAQSTNPALTLYQNAANESLKISVAHTGDGTAADPDIFGDMTFELFQDRAPRPANVIADLAKAGFYTNSLFHRVANNGPGNPFVIQGGISATNQTAAQFDDQFHNDLQHTSTGLLSMAKTSNDDTNTSQFFVTAAAPRFLDFNHSVFGRLTTGENIRAAIQSVPVGTGDKPVRDVKMTSVTVYMDTKNRVLTLSAPNGVTGDADVTVTVSDGNGGQAQKTFHVTIAADTTNNNPYLLDVAPIEITQGGNANFQLTGVDVEGTPIKYFFNEPSDPSMEATVDPNTGAGTLTAPSPNSVGVKSIFVGVAFSDSGPFDTQAVPIFVSPQAPTGLSLLAASDSGGNTSDHITRFDNSSPSNTLQFTVTGVATGRVVQLFDGNTLIGQATATGTSVTVTTNGTAALTPGTHSITAKQVAANQTVNVGNDHRTVNLSSVNSTGFAITIASDDWQNPAEALDVDGDGEVIPLDALLVINELNTNGARELGAQGPASGTTYYDADGDGSIKPLDALLIINELNSNSQSSQAHSSASSVPSSSSAVADPTVTVSPGVESGPVATDDQPDRRKISIGLAQPEITDVVFELSALSDATPSVADKADADAASVDVAIPIASTARSLHFSGTMPSDIEIELLDDIADFVTGLVA